ncbi:hypothetical protein ABPG72_013720 [Tetrahymena utriculariae]
MENIQHFNLNQTNPQLQQQINNNQIVYNNSTNIQNTNFTIQSSQNRECFSPYQINQNNQNTQQLEQRDTSFNQADNESAEQSDNMSDYLSELFDHLVENDDSSESDSSILEEDDSQMQVEQQDSQQIIQQDNQQSQEISFQNQIPQGQQQYLNQFQNNDESISFSSNDDQDVSRFISYKDFKLKFQNFRSEEANQSIEDSWDLNEDEFMQQSESYLDF